MNTLNKGTFIALDGNSYSYDVWYPLPFIVDGKEMIPTIKESSLLMIKSRDGSEDKWHPFHNRNDDTHWMVRREGWFSI